MQKAYRHEALTYQGQDEFVSSCSAIADEGRSTDSRVIFLVSAAKIDALRESLSGPPDDVALVSTDRLGRNPARIMTMLDTFQASGSGQPCVGVTEAVFRGRSPAAFAEAQFAEHVLNSVRLQDWPLSVVCLYDETEHDESSLAAMRRSHPAIRGQQANDRYDPELGTSSFGRYLDPPPDDVMWRDVRGDELTTTRTYLREQARRRAIPAARLEDFVFAANEIVTNSIRHGGQVCRLAVWSDDESVVCDVRDNGVITDPTLGRLAPPHDSPGGRGLWLANQLCDLVQIRSAPQGTVVRLRVDYVT